MGVTGRREQKLKSKHHPDMDPHRKRGRGGAGGGRRWEDGGQESLLVPVFLDREDPFPGEVFVFVVICELGLDGVVATGY